MFTETKALFHFYINKMNLFGKIFWFIPHLILTLAFLLVEAILYLGETIANWSMKNV